MDKELGIAYFLLFIMVNADMWVAGVWFRELGATIFSCIVPGIPQ
jgi:hypothetical protein